MPAYGKKIWVIPDTYLPQPTKSEIPSHEAIIFTNTGEKDANLLIDILFEDQEPKEGLKLKVMAKRSKHVRVDWFEDIVGFKIPLEVPYSMLVESDTKIVVQYSRMDTRLGAMALMTSLGYPCD